MIFGDFFFLLSTMSVSDDVGNELLHTIAYDISPVVQQRHKYNFLPWSHDYPHLHLFSIKKKKDFVKGKTCNLFIDNIFRCHVLMTMYCLCFTKYIFLLKRSLHTSSSLLDHINYRHWPFASVKIMIVEL